jgi:hypothetical protein
MTRSELARRDALLARQDKAAERWPGGKAKAFVDETSTVARDLEALAQEADERGGDPLERARTWRLAGLAHMDAAVGHRDNASLTSAARAFEVADALMVNVTDPVEKLKLQYAYGRTQFRLSRGKDLTLAAFACYRLTSALELARQFMPTLVRPVEEALVTAQQGLVAVQEGTKVDQEIASLGARVWAEHQREVRTGAFCAAEQPVVADAISKIAKAAQEDTPDMQAMISRRERIREAARDLVQAGSAAKDPLPPHSRAAEVWNLISPLKAALVADYFDSRKSQAFADEAKAAAQDLNNRFLEAETVLRQHADDEPWVRRYEDQALRPLALDVQTHLLRHHLTIVRPVWPSNSPTRRVGNVFYSGGEQVLNLVTSACEDAGLVLQRLPVGVNYASARWQALRSSQIAVFDFTAYKRVDLQARDLSSARAVAAVAYELGMALAIGYPVVIIAAEGQDLPFDLDISALRLPEPFDKLGGELPETLERAVYGMQRREHGNSLEATRLYLRRAIAAPGIASVDDALGAMDEMVDHNAVKLRRLAESVIGWAGDAQQMEIVFPCWPGSYPDSSRPTLFHVTPFGPAWANRTMAIVSDACRQSPAPVSYVRNDQVLDAEVIVSIWKHLCTATHVVADLTGVNPNVALELGMAHTLGRNTLLVSQDDPAEATVLHLAKARVHRYALDGSGERSLTNLLHRFLTAH